MECTLSKTAWVNLSGSFTGAVRRQRCLGDCHYSGNFAGHCGEQGATSTESAEVEVKEWERRRRNVSHKGSKLRACPGRSCFCLSTSFNLDSAVPEVSSIGTKISLGKSCSQFTAALYADLTARKSSIVLVGQKRVYYSSAVTPS